MKTPLYTALMLLGFVLLTACGGGGGQTPPPGDNTAPTVTSTFPDDSTGPIGVKSNILVTFSEDLLATTVDASSFTVSNSGNNVIGTVTYDALNDLAIFIPSNEYEALTTYTATLSTSITDLSGNALTTNYSWSFTTGGSGSGGAWGTATLIETDNAGNALSPEIAFDSSGNAIAVWSQNDGTRYNIWANRFDGTNWGTAILIESDNSGSAFASSIAFDGNGNAIAVWDQSDGTRSNIWANRFNGTNWGTPTLIESDDAGDARYPQIAFDNNGNAIAVWQQYDDGTRDNIMANRFDGTNWGTPVMIASNSAGFVLGSPQIAFDGSGNAIAVWDQHDDLTYLNFSIWANHFDGTNWSSASLLENGNSGTASAPQIAFDSNGNAIVVWHQFEGIRSSIFANRFDGTNWLPSPALVETDDVESARFPQIAFDGSGNAIVVWQQNDGTRENIWANRYNVASNTWSGFAGGAGPVLIENDAENANSPRIAIDSSGKAIAVWRQNNGHPLSSLNRLNIFANRFDGTNWATATNIAYSNAGDAYPPDIAFDSNGNAIAAWGQNDGTRDNIWVNHFK